MTRIQVPQPISESLTFRWFVEYIIDNSPLFKVASAIAKASLVLGADLDTAGGYPEIPESALKLVRDALSSDEQPLQLPVITGHKLDEDGKSTGESFTIPPRVLAGFIAALSTDAEPAA